MTVYCIQEPPGTAGGNPKYNVMKALSFGEVKFLLTERAQLVYSAGSLINKLRNEDFLLLVGDPAIIAATSALVADINHGKFKVLKWDRMAGKYYPLSINLYQKEDKDYE